MERYYLLDGNKVLGPYTLNQMQEQHLTLNSLICREGTEDWKKFSEFSELLSLKSFLPPPAPPKSINRKVILSNSIKLVFSKASQRALFIIVIISLCFGVGGGLFLFYEDGGSDAMEKYNEYRSFKLKYNISDTQLECSQEAAFYLTIDTHWGRDRYNFHDIHEAEAYYKEQYLKIRTYSIIIGVITPLITILFFIAILIIGNYVALNKKNMYK